MVHHGKSWKIMVNVPTLSNMLDHFWRECTACSVDNLTVYIVSYFWIVCGQTHDLVPHLPFSKYLEDRFRIDHRGWHQPCHIPTMTGDGFNTTYKNGDASGMVDYWLYRTIVINTCGNYGTYFLGLLYRTSMLKIRIPLLVWCLQCKLITTSTARCNPNVFLRLQYLTISATNGMEHAMWSPNVWIASPLKTCAENNWIVCASITLYYIYHIIFCYITLYYITLHYHHILLY